MAKNTFNADFRQINVDAYSEDNFREEETDPMGPTGPDEKEVISLLNQNKFNEALKTVLRCAPLGSKNQKIKDDALSLTLKVLFAIKSAQIGDAVAALDDDLVDVLMKYIYRGFENPVDVASGHLLLWHEKVYSVGGAGSIIRVLTDTRRI